MSDVYDSQLDLLIATDPDNPWIEQYKFLHKYVSNTKPTLDDLSSQLDKVYPGDEDVVLACSLHLTPGQFATLLAKARRVSKTKPKGPKIRRRT